jgi:hypothetical protein
LILEVFDSISQTLQHLAQCLTLRVKHWRPKGVATDSDHARQ